MPPSTSKHDTNALAQGASVTDVFSYTVTDEHGATSTAKLTITTTGTHDAPVAVADPNATVPFTVFGVQAAGKTPTPSYTTLFRSVLTNDTDVDTGHVLTVAAVNGVSGNVGAAV